MRQELCMEDTLVGEVVNRKESRRGDEKGILVVDRGEICRQEPCLPVVSVDEVRRWPDPLAKFQDGAIEIGKPLDLEIAVAVNVTAREVVGIVYEIDRHALEIILPDAGIPDTAGEGYIEIIKELPPGVIMNDIAAPSGTAVARCRNYDVTTEPLEGFGERTGDICQATCLGIGDDFRRCENDSHGTTTKNTKGQKTQRSATAHSRTTMVGACPCPP